MDSIRNDLVKWSEGLKFFDEGDYESSITILESISDTSKLSFNLGLIYHWLDYQDYAIEALNKAISLDGYFAIAFFQRGVCTVMLGEFEKAIEDFDTALSLLNNNDYIDYSQLGLAYQLHASEIIFNRALCFMELNNVKSAKVDLDCCRKMKLKPDQEDNILKALDTNGEEGDLVTLSPGTLFRPPSEKVQNLEKKNFLFKAKVVASVNGRDSYIGFMGAKMLQKPRESERYPTYKDSESVRYPTYSESVRYPTYKEAESQKFPTLQPLDKPQNIFADYPDEVYRNKELRRRPSNSSETSIASSCSLGPDKIKVKCRLTDTRMIVVSRTVTYSEIYESIKHKFRVEGELLLEYKDEDGEYVIIGDNDDLEVALLTEETLGKRTLELKCRVLS